MAEVNVRRRGTGDPEACRSGLQRTSGDGVRAVPKPAAEAAANVRRVPRAVPKPATAARSGRRK